MTNYFRQLILSVLPVLGVLLLLSGGWFRYEAVTQQKAQIQQFVAVLQVSLRPHLSSENTDPLITLMSNAQYVSTVPVEAVMLLNKNGDIITSTVSHYVVSPEWLYSQNMGFRLYKQYEKLVAVQPLFSTADTDLNHVEQQYLVMIFADTPLWSVWLLPVILIVITAWFILFIVKQQQQRSLSRLQTDIGFIAHKLQQGHWVATADEPVVTELQPIIQQLNQLPWQQSPASEHTRPENKPALQLQNEQLYTELTVLNQKLDRQKEQQQQWLHNHQLLLQQYPDIKAEELIRYAENQLWLARFNLNDKALTVNSFLPTAWLAKQLAVWQVDAKQKRVDIQLIEHADLLRYQLSCVELSLANLLKPLVRICLNTSGISELIIRSAVTNYQLNQAEFDFTLTTNGQGLTEREIKLLNGDMDESSLQWNEADIGCIRLLLQQLNAVFSVHCLSGIGCTLRLSIPVTAICSEFASPLEQLLVFDHSLTVLDERKSGLSTLAVNTDFCWELTELEKKQAITRYDAVLIFLPDISALPRWILLVQTLRKNTSLLCYARPQNAALWEKALQFPIMTEVFCLEHIMQLVKQQQQLPHLLVVDDNQINLSFVQVLLKNKAVRLTLADTGNKALELCRQQHFDAVLLDIQLPDISGIEVALQLRQQQAYNKIPILAFTAHASEHEQDAFKAAGMDAVIIKPLEATKAETILSWCRLGLRQQHYAG